MFKIFKTLILFIWLIDILNIDFIINDIHMVYFLDTTLPINFWFWLLAWLLMPTTGTNCIIKEADIFNYDKYIKFKKKKGE